MILTIFSCVYWPFVYLPWGNVYSSESFTHFPIYCLFCCWVLWFLIRYMICKYILYRLPVYSLPIEWPWLFCQKLFNHACEGLFLCSLFYWFLFAFMLVPHCFDYCSFAVSFAISNIVFFRVVLYLRLFQLFQVLWGFLWVLEWVFLFLQKKKITGIFDRNYIESVNHFGWYWRFNNIKFSNSCDWDGFSFMS